jgi:hypothetical protein
VLHEGQQLNAKWQARLIERLGRLETRIDRLDRQLSARDHRLQTVVELATPMLEQTGGLEHRLTRRLELLEHAIGGTKGER